MRAAMFIGAALTLAIIPATSPPNAHALTASEIGCQSKIFAAAQDFVSDKLKAIVDCNDKSDGCNAGKRDRQIAKATTRLSRTIGRECRGVTLENLGFPGAVCSNGGGSFSTDDLGACLAERLETFVDDALALAYPGGTPPSFSGNEGQCQNVIGGQTRVFINRKLRARTTCLELQLKGKISDTVDCLAPVPPGTGDPSTDKDIQKAIARLHDKIRRGCRGANLETLGFPGTCEDSSPNNFTASELASCLEPRLELAADQIAALLLPLIGPQPTPTATDVETPTPTETPTPAETPTAVETSGETPTPTETVTAEETATPTPGETPVETATAGETPVATGTPETMETATGAVETATPGPDSTETPAPVATETVSPVATETPGPDATETPGPDATETPGPDATETVGPVATETPTPVPTSTPGGEACASQITFLANGSAADLDTGWTGQSHDNLVINNGLVTANLSCGSGTAPCGICDVSGPLPNAGGTTAANPSNNRRCSSDTAVACSADSDCTGLGTCQFFFGAPLPLSSGGVSVCVVNQVVGALTGTVDLDTGDASNNVNLISRVFNGPTVSEPCPTCGTGGFGSTGTCSFGLHPGGTCTVNGTSDLFGSTSFDCPPNPGAVIANLNIPLNLSTGLQTRTLSADSPNCTANGFTTLKCFCDTCPNGDACATNADCGGAECGAKRCISGSNVGAACTLPSECPGSSCGRPGKTTAPNECDDGTCSPNAGDTDSVNEGECLGGPFEQFCNLERFRGCTGDPDCTAAGDTCSFGKNRECYTDNGVVDASLLVQGAPDPFVGGVSHPTLGSFFCVGPTTAPAVNGVAGLPGLGRLTLPGTATLIP